jgi:hypothetical protein
MGMDVAKIQQQVRRLPASQRKKLTAWMVSKYPVLSVDRLMAKAAREVKAGKWTPEPPTEDNFPKGKTLEHALQVADRLGIRK